MNRDMNIEEILKRIGNEDVPADVHKIAEETAESFSKTLMPQRQHILWSDIMKSRITKFAAAAVIVIAVLAGLPFFTGNGSGVLLAGVLEKVEQAQAFMYRMKMTTTGAMMPGMPAGKTEAEGTVTISNEYGMKMEMITLVKLSQEDQMEMTQQMLFLPDQKAMLTLMPDLKKYTRIELDDEMFANTKKQNNDPREMVKQIMKCEYTELGRSVIDGIEVEGFETTDPSFMAGMAKDVKMRLWVDVETWLPVRQELDINVNEQMQMQQVVYDYQWDIQVDASEFEIPPDYSLLAEVEMPSIKFDEGKTIQGLRAFAEIADGKYPSSMTVMAITQEASKALAESMAIDLIKDPNQEVTQKLMNKMMLLQAPIISYTQLVQQNKDPAYYGDTVTAEDADAVLMRWKVSDDQYRVIFGDLTAENVSAERLAELEELLPQ
jgi:outer membrane lipoprotein-sorting protein